MRALRGPARIGWICVQDEDGMLFEPDGSTLKFSARLDKVHKVATAIAERGLGHAAAVKFGLQFSASDGMSEPELWYKGLLRAKENAVQPNHGVKRYVLSSHSILPKVSSNA